MAGGFGGLGGLAFIGQGYDSAAESYWRRKLLEDAAAGAGAVVNTDLSSPSPDNSGATPMSLQSPVPPTSLVGMQPPGTTPSFSRLGIPPAGVMPGLPSGIAGADADSGVMRGGGATLSTPLARPNSPVGMNPNQFQMIPRNQLPFNQGAPQQDVPGQGPILPPGQVQPGYADAVRQAREQLAGRMQGQQLIQQQGTAPLSQMSWMDVLQRIKRANPNLPPGAIISAMNQVMPWIRQDQAQEFKQIQEQMRMLQITQSGILGQERLDQAARIAAENADLKRQLETMREGASQKRVETQVEGRKDVEASREQSALQRAQMTDARAKLAMGMKQQELAQRQENWEKNYSMRREGLNNLEWFRSPEGKAAIAGATALPKAQAATLGRLEQQLAAVTAFEETAVSNGRNLLRLATKVDNNNNPTINRWINNGRRALAGDTDVTNFDAQLRTWRTEAGRIINNPNLTGNLTNQVRNEMKEVIPDNVTLSQLNGLVKLMEDQDFTARHQSIVNQVNRIRDELSGAKQPEASKPLPGMSGESSPSGEGWKTLPGGGRYRELGPRSEGSTLGRVASYFNPVGSAQAAEQPPGRFPPGKTAPSEFLSLTREPREERGGAAPKPFDYKMSPKEKKALIRQQGAARREIEEMRDMDKQWDELYRVQQGDASSIIETYKGSPREEKLINQKIEQLKIRIANYGEGPKVDDAKSQLKMLRKRLREIDTERVGDVMERDIGTQVKKEFK